MRELDLPFRTMFAELGERCLDARFTMDFPIDGTETPLSVDGYFAKVTVKDQEFWYHRVKKLDGKRKDTYVGRVSDPEITSRVEAFETLKDDFKGRRSLVRSLTGTGGLPSPDRFTGEVVEALANAGIFRLRGVLVGTVAFQCYAGFLGVHLPSAAMQTGDADFAQFFSISSAVNDTMPPMIETLRELDATFRDIPSRKDPLKTTQYINASKYKVEFLTPNTGSDDYADQPAEMPALGGASAQPLRFLDFLIKDPVRSVMLHRGGISVLVPAPERYAIHKLIVASRRLGDDNGQLKRSKDVIQASLLIHALSATRRQDDLADVYAEAWDRGAAWKEAITRGLSYLQPTDRAVVDSMLEEGLKSVGLDPADYGFDTSSAPSP